MEQPATVESEQSARMRRLDQQSDEALEGSRRFIGIAERAMGDEDAIRSRATRELEPIRQRVMDRLSQPLPERPRFKETPPAPKGNDPRSDESWLMASALLGALGGALTRRHVTNALAAFTGAVQGYQEGSREKFDQNMKIWDAEHKRAVEQNTNALNEYREILEDRKLSDQQANTLLQLASQKYEDQAMQTAARTKNALNIAQLYDKQFQALEQLKASGSKINQQWKIDQAERIVSQSGSLIESILNYQSPPRSMTPRDTVAGMADAQIMRRVYDLAIERGTTFDPGKFARDQAVLKQQALIPGRVEAAGLSAAERTGQVRATNLEAAARSAGPLIEMAGEAARGVPATAFPRLNRILQATAEELGDPALERFQFANIELGRLLARVINPNSAVVTNAAAAQAASLFLTSASPEGYQAALEQARSLIQREFKAAQEQKSHAPLSAIEIGDTTDRRLMSTP